MLGFNWFRRLLGLNRFGRTVDRSLYGKGAPDLEVIRDPGAIDEARRAFSERCVRRVRSMVENAEQISLLSPDCQCRLTQYRDVFLRDLPGQLESSDPNRRVGAAMALAFLKDPRGSEALRRLMDDPSAILPLLWRSNEEEMIILKDVPGLHAWLIDKLHADDHRVRSAAVEFAGVLGRPEFAHHLLEIARSPELDPAGRAMYWLSQIAPSAELLACIAARIEYCSKDEGDGAFGRRMDTLGPLRAYANVANADLRDQAAEVARRGLLTYPVKAWLSGATMAAFHVICAASAGKAAAILEELHRVCPNPRLRAEALEHLAKVSPSQAAGHIEQALSQASVSDAAIRALARSVGPSNSAACVARLRSLIRKSRSDMTLTEIARALCGIQHPSAREVLQSLLPRLRSWAATDVRWSLHGITSESAAQRLMDMGLIHAEAVNAVRASRHAEDHAEGVFRLLIELSEQHGVLGFDTETGQIPAEHDELIEEFARSSNGHFHPECPLELYEEDDDGEVQGDYTVQFIHADRLYRFRARNLGDWYDVCSVLGAV